MVTSAIVRRVLRHVFYPRWRLRATFADATLDRIEAAVRDCERRHSGELRFVIEGGLDGVAVARGLTPRARALELFSQLRVWDTAANNGVLVYVQVVDRDIEIVADRGFNGKVAQDAWDAVCRRMEEAFHAGRYEAGVLEAIAAVGSLLARHYPPAAHDADELPNRPVML